MIGAELTIQLAALRLLSGLLIATVQGLTMAAAAVLLGDRGPRYDGRLTLLPTRHVSLVGLAALTLSGFGWSQPVAIDAANLRGGRWSLVLIVLLGSAVLLALAALLASLTAPLLVMLPYTAGLSVAAFLRVAARLSVWLALFTALPLPPLAGAHLLAAVGIRLPASTGTVIGWALLALCLLGVTRQLLTPAYDVLAPLILGDAAGSTIGALR